MLKKFQEFQTAISLGGGGGWQRKWVQKIFSTENFTKVFSSLPFCSLASPPPSSPFPHCHHFTGHKTSQLVVSIQFITN